MRIVRLTRGDEHIALAGAGLFDAPPTEAWTSKFLSSQGHHLLIALDDRDTPIGFVSGVETTHPDKGTEMFLYELSVRDDQRRQGVGRSLVDRLAELATYRAAGAAPPEPSVTLTWKFGRH
jgi:aminoglycoside 3-N-acetyltransferase I